MKDKLILVACVGYLAWAFITGWTYAIRDDARRGVKIPGVELAQDLWRDISHRAAKLTDETKEDFNEYRETIRK